MLIKNLGFFDKSIDLMVRFFEIINSNLNLTILRILKRTLLSFKADIIYLIEEANWAIEWVGYYVTNNLKRKYQIKAEIASQYFAKNKIIHYGSITCLIRKKFFINLNESNCHILTWFHITHDDSILKILIPYLNQKLDLIHTSHNFTKEKLINFGFDEHKIIVIPLGVDLSVFKKFNEDKRKNLRNQFKLPQNKIIIGSFQQDCWKNGIPVERKGPDIFCKVLEKLDKKYSIHVLLTGPGRIYVKKKLKSLNISYTHVFLHDYLEMVNCYNVLDLYLITSKIEGGPLALLESMATGVPVVTTKVGMTPALIKNGYNGFITDVDDIEELCKSSSLIIENNELKNKIIHNASKSITDYSWEKIIKQYYDKIYKKYLKL